MYDKIIRDSIAPSRVRTAIDRILATGAPLPALDENALRRFVRIAETSRLAVEVLRSQEAAREILETGAYVPAPIGFDPKAEVMRRDLALGLFHVIVTDVLELRPFVETLGLLSDLADRSIRRALATAWQELTGYFGLPGECATSAENPHPGFSVLGLGKLGGRELNFFSDIDLIFLYRGEGESSGGSRGRLDNVQWYTRLANRVLELLSSKLLSPIAYRVDMRLRPEGNAGPIVRSLDSTVRYYEREGSQWERQALLKARVSAGDETLGAELFSRLEPFIYRRYLDRDFIFQIESIKGRIEAQAAEHGRRHVKLAVGAIREIEFIVQIMQLADGGRCRAVRTASTLEALDRLTENRYLLESDRDLLKETYLFLRRVEHRLQMMDGRQTHILPEDANEMEIIARGLGFGSGLDLWESYLERTSAVRRLFERRFRSSKEISVTPIEEKLIDLLDEGRDEEARARILEELGLSRDSIGHIRSLSRGSIADPPTSSVRRLFLRSAAVWMPMALAMPEPNETLRNLANMVNGYGAKALLYDIFTSHPPVADLVVNIAGLSTPLAHHIVGDPSSFEALLSPGGVTSQRDETAVAERFAALRESITNERRAKMILKSEEHLRIGVRFLMGLSTAAEAGRQLTALSELLLGETEFAAGESATSLSPPGTGAPSFATIALGRFAGRALGLASDLDLVFVTDGDVTEATGEARKKLEEWQKLGLKVDMRLRPMGRTAPLVVSLDYLRSYFAKDAETWERVAWSLSRVIAGPGVLRERCEEAIGEFLFGREFGEKERGEMKAMRARLLEEAAGGELKRGAGGLIDIDFMAAEQRFAAKTRETDPAILLKDVPGMKEAFVFLRSLDAASHFANGHAFRGDEPTAEEGRLRVILSRHGMKFEDLARHRQRIATGC